MAKDPVTLLKYAFYIAKNHFHEWWAFASISLLLVFLFIPIDNEIIDNIIVSQKIRIAIYAPAYIAFFIFWATWRWRLPRNKKGKLGLVIAIYVEDNLEKQRLKSDFIKKLEDCLASNNLHEVVSVIPLKNHISQSINNPNDIKRVAKKVKAHFYVYGILKKRAEGLIDKYFFQLRGFVVHRPVEERVSKMISVEFSKVLPSEISFWEKIQLQGFEFSAEFAYLSARYIVGIAALASGDIFLARRMHAGLYEELGRINPVPEHFQEVRNNVLALLSTENLLFARDFYLNKQDTDNAKLSLHQALNYNPRNSDAWMLKAVIDFCVDKDIAKAKESTRQAKENGDRWAWRYNKAFFYFWEGNYPEALYECRTIKRKGYIDNPLFFQSIFDFNKSLLSTNPEKTQLWFWMGFVAYFMAGNLNVALEGFENFCEFCNNRKHPLLSDARRYLKDVKEEMGIK
jgi:tetratricopeptide (TPR) repeat protein